MGVQGVAFTVNWNPAGCSGTVTTWPADAQAAFQYAVDLWSTLVNGSQTIVVNACWRTDLGASVLGSAGAVSLHGNFTGASYSNTWYNVALANQLYGGDLNDNDSVDRDGDSLDADAEIRANFSATRSNWYFGTDGNPGASEYDFVTVVMHEIAHGLGFSGFMNYDDGNAGNGTECTGTSGVGCWGYGSGYPKVYDHFTANGSSQYLLDTGTFGNPSAGGVPRKGDRTKETLLHVQHRLE